MRGKVCKRDATHINTRWVAGFILEVPSHQGALRSWGGHDLLQMTPDWRHHRWTVFSEEWFCWKRVYFAICRVLCNLISLYIFAEIEHVSWFVCYLQITNFPKLSRRYGTTVLANLLFNDNQFRNSTIVLFIVFNAHIFVRIYSPDWIVQFFDSLKFRLSEARLSEGMRLRVVESWSKFFFTILLISYFLNQVLRFHFNATNFNNWLLIKLLNPFLILNDGHFDSSQSSSLI